MKNREEYIIKINNQEFKVDKELYCLMLPFGKIINELKKQQKEFVKYLEDEIKRLKESKKYAIEVFNNKAVINLDLAKKSIEEYRLLIAQSEKILSKYNEIIGGENE